MQILEGSRAIAYTIKNISPKVISAYPITPQTHIVEDLAQFKADEEADYEYVLAESEFAAASIIAGASSAGSRVYSATSSQGLLLMSEVLFNIAGMRLPIIITCANRGISAPITIWNDHQDAVTIRDAGWIMFFAENHQESVQQHILAYKIAEKLNLPVMINIDGYILTHSYEPVFIPSASKIKKFLLKKADTNRKILDPQKPITMGALASPDYYMEIRQELHQDIMASAEVIKNEYEKYIKIFQPKNRDYNNKYKSLDNGLIEYYGPPEPQTILIAKGSVVGTIKEMVDNYKKVGVIKVKVYRPFPGEEIKNIIKKVKNVAVLDKSISLGQEGPLALDVKALKATYELKSKIQGFVVGLGGRDITQKMIKDIISLSQKQSSKNIFICK